MHGRRPRRSLWEDISTGRRGERGSCCVIQQSQPTFTELLFGMSFMPDMDGLTPARQEAQRQTPHQVDGQYREIYENIWPIDDQMTEGRKM